jgi:type I pantothenate kinase
MTKRPTSDPRLSPYMTFSRAEWAKLRASVPLPLTEDDLRVLRGLNEPISLDEVTAIYLPLARLLHMYVDATQSLYQVTDTFLGNPAPKVPYVIAIAGSVAVGKSTTARVLRALLECGPGQPSVDLITTDGFLYPNAVLEERGLMRRKGFPESYDVRRLVHVMAEVKSGLSEVTAPIYSHLIYDIVPDAMQTIRQPDILIVEGLNVLQRGESAASDAPRVFVSDFFDFSIYVDADEQNLHRWYVERFLRLRETAFRDPESYFRRYADLTIAEAKQVATRIWSEINAANLRANIAPTRERARLILEKGGDHLVQSVHLRKL